jgi:hypothetical protein
MGGVLALPASRQLETCIPSRFLHVDWVQAAPARFWRRLARPSATHSSAAGPSTLAH